MRSESGRYIRSRFGRRDRQGEIFGSRIKSRREWGSDFGLQAEKRANVDMRVTDDVDDRCSRIFRYRANPALDPSIRK